MLRTDRPAPASSDCVAIAPMRAEDAARVAELSVEAFGDGAHPVVVAGTVSDWLHVHVLRERSDGDIVAFVQYWQAHEDTHVVAIATRAESRGRGHASRLLERVIALAHIAGCCRVTLRAQSSDPITAKLYLKHRFSLADPRPGGGVPAGTIFLALALPFARNGPGGTG